MSRQQKMPEKSESKQIDQIASFAALLRAIAWPGVVLYVVFYFSYEIQILARSVQKLNIAGVELETWVETSSLTRDQLNQIKVLGDDEIIRMFSEFRPGQYSCRDKREPLQANVPLHDAGLLEFVEEGCPDYAYSVVLTDEGRRLRDALADTFENIIQRTIR